MIERKKKSVIPVYGITAAWVLYCLFFPLYTTWHFIIVACLAVLVYFFLSMLFPGKTEQIELPAEPERSGDESIDSLLAEGEAAVAEMSRLRDSIPEILIRGKIDELMSITGKIFRNLLQAPGDYSRIKRFAGLYLPTTMKLLHDYDRLGKSGVSGENILGTLGRIEAALDTIIDSYRKFFDSLFASQALDIETDIIVLEQMLRSEGLIEKVFIETN